MSPVLWSGWGVSLSSSCAVPISRGGHDHDVSFTSCPIYRMYVLDFIMISSPDIKFMTSNFKKGRVFKDATGHVWPSKSFLTLRTAPGRILRDDMNQARKTFCCIMFITYMFGFYDWIELTANCILLIIFSSSLHEHRSMDSTVERPTWL